MKKLSIATTGAVLIAFAMVSNAQATTFTFNTSDSQFDPGIDNQGWWSNTYESSDGNDNYFVGTEYFSTFRDFFTFDLSSLSENITSGRLELQRYDSNSGNPTETLGLFDVSTDAATLNNNTGNNLAIYNDLGSGVNYGTFEVSTAGNGDEILSFTLNSAAIANMNAARGGFFSIGGSILTEGNLFGFSGGDGTQQLVVDTAATPVPFEFSPGLGIVALGALGGLNQIKNKVLKRKFSKSTFSVN